MVNREFALVYDRTTDGWMIIGRDDDMTEGEWFIQDRNLKYETARAAIKGLGS